MFLVFLIFAVTHVPVLLSQLQHILMVTEGEVVSLPLSMWVTDQMFTKKKKDEHTTYLDSSF